jgi:hypothetical protein
MRVLEVKMKPTQTLAREIVAAHPGIREDDLETLRDVVDGYTCGDLDTFQLDLLTDWVVAIAKQRLAA